MKKIRIAIQKSGRLSEKCLKLLKQCDLQFDMKSRTLITRAKNHPVELMLVRDDDIPQYVRDGVCDLGIVGLNEVAEKVGNPESGDSQVSILKKLGFGQCRLSLAVPKATKLDTISDFEGKTIATSYPSILLRYLKDNKVSANIVEISGSVELAPSIGVADGICDLVSTGATLDSNGLEERMTILDSEAVLIRTQKTLDEQQNNFIERLLQRVDSSLRAKNAKYIMMNAPKASLDKISELIPGMERPTVMPLMFDDEKVAIHAVAKEDVLWNTMEQLKDAGASSILVLPIEKIID